MDTEKELEDFGFSFSFEDEDKHNKMDVKKGPDRFRMGYYEVCLEGFKCRSLWDLAELLEEHDYMLVDAEATGLTYYSLDGKTEIYVDEALDSEDDLRAVTILRGELTEDELPGAEQEIKNLFYSL